MGSYEMVILIPRCDKNYHYPRQIYITHREYEEKKFLLKNYMQNCDDLQGLNFAEQSTF